MKQINFSFLIYLIFLALINFTHNRKVNNRPVIGILTTPSSFPDQYVPWNWSYIPASYFKFIEAAGARGIPIPYDATPENITYLFHGTNGLLFTGGGSNQWINNPNNTRTAANITQAATLLIDLVIKENNKGVYYPLWATCQGFQLVSEILAQNLFLVGNIAGDINTNRNISFTYNAPYSRLWGSAPEEIIVGMVYQNVTNFDHINAVSVERFYRNKHYYEFANLLVVSYAGYGRSYVASIEGKNYPIYANQFHPEKNNFEWQPIVTAPHDYLAVIFSQYCANFFVKEARRNNKSFSDPKVLNESLIYNWNLITPMSELMGPAYMFPTVADNPQAWPVLYGNYTGDNESQSDNE